MIVAFALHCIRQIIQFPAIRIDVVDVKNKNISDHA